jgi:predicted phage-related endonuclease
MQATAERHPRAKNIVEYDFAQTMDYDIYAAAKEYKELQRKIETLKAQLEEAKKVIIEDMAGAEEVTAKEYTVRNQTIERIVFDSKKLQKEKPSVYDKYSKPSTSTRFAID